MCDLTDSELFDPAPRRRYANDPATSWLTSLYNALVVDVASRRPGGLGASTVRIPAFASAAWIAERDRVAKLASAVRLLRALSARQAFACETEVPGLDDEGNLAWSAIAECLFDDHDDDGLI